MNTYLSRIPKPGMLVVVLILVVFVLAAGAVTFILTGTQARPGAENVTAAPYVFESQSRVVAKGSDPQIGVRASGELFLLSLRDGQMWLQTSGDGGDSFQSGVRVNDVGTLASHSENTPQMIVRTMREFYVLWTAESAADRTAHGHDRKTLRLSKSVDWGKSFGKSVLIDPSGPASQQFYTFAVGSDGAVYVAWLDGRDREQSKSGSTALYLAKSVDRGETFSKSVRVGLNVCPCCRPSIAMSDAKTLHIGWRGVRDQNVRDIFVATSTDGGATFGAETLVAADNWQINGCPHSGPSLATLKGQLFVAWQTISEERSRLFIASSKDNGAHFAAKVVADADLDDPNHPLLAQIDDKLGLVFQARPSTVNSESNALANQDNVWGRLDIYFRQINKDGALTTPQRIGHANGSATYPALLYESPNHLFIAWTEGSDDSSQIVMARGRITNATSRSDNKTTDTVARRGENDE